MKKILIALMLVSLTACSTLTKQQKNVTIGAGAGAVAGAVLTGGSSLAVVGGAALGGYIGNDLKLPKK
jgi:osmotically inducible lipoprotein OsmB